MYVGMFVLFKSRNNGIDAHIFYYYSLFDTPHIYILIVIRIHTHKLR